MTADIDAFHAAVFADLADPLPRLVYADWLDDRGEADYAALIRTYAHGLGRPRGRLRADVRQRQAEHHRALMRHWRVRDLFTGKGPPMAHGVLPDALHLTAAELRRAGEWPVYLRPRDLHLAVAAGDELEWSAGLASATALTLAAVGPPPQSAGPVLTAVAGTPHLPRLRRLDLSGFPPAAGDLTAFAASALAGRLTGFDLSYPDGTDEEDDWGHRWPRYQTITADGDVPAGLRAATAGLPPG